MLKNLDNKLANSARVACRIDEGPLRTRSGGSEGQTGIYTDMKKEGRGRGGRKRLSYRQKVVEQDGGQRECSSHVRDLRDMQIRLRREFSYPRNK